MRGIPQPLKENFPPVTLYQDEIEEIVGILKGVSESIKMSAVTNPENRK